MPTINVYLLLPESVPCNRWMKNNEPFQSEQAITIFIKGLIEKVEDLSIENYTGFYDLKNVNNFLHDFNITEDYYPNPVKRLLASSIRSFQDWRTNVNQSSQTSYTIFSEVIADHSFCEIAQRSKDNIIDRFIVINHYSHDLPDNITVSVNGTDVRFISAVTKTELINWFVINRHPPRNFHVVEKHGENKTQIRIENNKTISPLRCSEKEAQELLNSAIGPSLKELFNFDKERKFYIVFKFEGNNPQNLYHGYHVEFESTEVPDEIKRKLEFRK